jgi:hypothetical protein
MDAKFKLTGKERNHLRKLQGIQFMAGSFCLFSDHKVILVS